MSRRYYESIRAIKMHGDRFALERLIANAYMRLDEMILCDQEMNDFGRGYNLALSAVGAPLDNMPFSYDYWLYQSLRKRLRTDSLIWSL